MTADEMQRVVNVAVLVGGAVVAVLLLAALRLRRGPGDGPPLSPG